MTKVQKCCQIKKDVLSTRIIPQSELSIIVENCELIFVFDNHIEHTTSKGNEKSIRICT